MSVLSGVTGSSALIMGAILAGGCSTEDKREKTAMAGEQVYKQTCSVCHGGGVAGAPKFMDGKDWKPLVEEGQVVLSAHGWVGVRGMPPKGGDPNLTLEEFARAVAFMGRGAGAAWQDPDAAMLEAIGKEVSARRQELARKK